MAIIYNSLNGKNKDKLQSAFKRGKPLVISGPPGSGKTKLVQEYASLFSEFLQKYSMAHEIKVVNIAMNKTTDIESLFGQAHREKNGSVSFVPGVLLSRLEYVVFNFDEATRSSTHVFTPILGLLATDRSDPELFLLSLPGLSCKVYIGWASAVCDQAKGLTNYKRFERDETYTKMDVEAGHYFIKTNAAGHALEYVFLFKNTWLLTFTVSDQDRDLISAMSESLSRRVDSVKLEVPDVGHIRRNGMAIFKQMILDCYSKYDVERNNKIWDNDFFYGGAVSRVPSDMEMDELLRVLTTIMRTCNKNEEYNREKAPYLREGCVGVGYGILKPFIESYLTADRSLVITDEECYQKAYESTLERFLEDDIHYYPTNVQMVKAITINTIRQCVGLDNVEFTNEVEVPEERDGLGIETN